MLFGNRSRSRLRDKPSKREVAERGLIPFAKQVEQRGALREVVVRVGGVSTLRVQSASQPQIFAPCGGRGRRVERYRGVRQPLLGFRQTAGRCQRFGGD